MSVSLLWKWLPTENSSNNEAYKKIRNYLKLSPKQYRQMVSKFRAKLEIVENKMCANKWDEINFSHVPSNAMKNYRKAFAKHEPARWEEYLGAVETGTAKINASTLYPHEITTKVRMYSSDIKSLELQWKALPNYMSGEVSRILPVSDVSGSMSGLPMDVCIGLSLYVAERNEGIFKNAFITFSSKPELQYVSGNSLKDRIKKLATADWGGNTNLKATFDLILSKAKKHNISEDEMPEMVIIFSDMQFDAACHGTNKSMVDQLKIDYEKAGYKMPKLVFWNLRAALTNNPVTIHHTGTSLVSGFSPSLLKSILSAKSFSPKDIMLETLLNKRYEAVTI